MSATVFNMPSGVPFLRSLAHGLTEVYGERLQDGLVLLPTRRAARGLADAFVRQAAERGTRATLLPRLRPLADVNPDEPPFEPGELAGIVSPAIDPVQRRFEVAQLVVRYHERTQDQPLDPAAAIHMADPLIEIMDDAALEGVTIRDQAEWARICEDSATHFQHAGQLYRIVDAFWPERLSEIGMMEPAARRVALLHALAEIWSAKPPDYPVIIAGSTGTLGATAELMRVVANMPDGMVVLPGLQEDFPEGVWETIDLRHPQSSLKNLLATMEVDRADVRSWPHVVDGRARGAMRKRRRILAEALVPVDATGDWIGRIDTLVAGEGADLFETALDGLSLIEAGTEAEEALSIALIMREALEQNGRTAALVTPDQMLAQRVRARLSRWGVDVAMSQGQPVEQTPIGVFLTALLDLARDPFGPVEISLVLNHPLTRLGRGPGEAKSKWSQLECKHFRGVRPDAKVYGGEDVLSDLYTAIAPLTELGGHASPDAWASALVEAAGRVGAGAGEVAAFRLWSGDDGRQAGSLLDGVANHGASLPDTDAQGFSRLLGSLLQGAVVRPSAGTHPRLSILGPLEARLLEADVVILGGLNEGTWPGAATSGPFLSRGMRENMKLSLPERRYGLAAHDFAELAANPTVYLTRATKGAAGPTVASRWVWRLKTLLRGAMPDRRVDALLGTGARYLDWARQMDRPERHVFIERPNPKPPVEKRWNFVAKDGVARRMSITAVSRWIRDPYSIYGKHVLCLETLEPLDSPPDARHFGTAMHEGIEHFVLADPKRVHVAGRQDELAKRMGDALIKHGYSEDEVFKEEPRLQSVAKNLIDWFGKRSDADFHVAGTEVWAEHVIADLDFKLVGLLDLVEDGPNGYAFTDFKTGTPTSAKTVAAGFDLQLPLAAWLAAEGSLQTPKDGPFTHERYPKAATREMGYVRIKGSNDDFRHSHVAAPGVRTKGAPTAPELADEAIKIFRELILAFDKPEQGYSSQPRAQYTHDYGEYDDLARRDEWSAISGGDE